MRKSFGIKLQAEPIDMDLICNKSLSKVLPSQYNARIYSGPPERKRELR